MTRRKVRMRVKSWVFRTAGVIVLLSALLGCGKIASTKTDKRVAPALPPGEICLPTNGIPSDGGLWRPGVTPAGSLDVGMTQPDRIRHA